MLMACCKFILLGCCFLVFLVSCQDKTPYPYSISDFAKVHQTHLYNIVTAGVVKHEATWESEKYIEKNFSDAGLKKLARSEHPVLRAVALRALLGRKSVNHQSILLSHLDDTALITVYIGGWGLFHRMVADDMIIHARWKTPKAKNVIIKEVITKHNYLRSAYTILSKISPGPEYYLHIKKMIGRQQHPYEEVEQGFYIEEREMALYRLAQYKRPEDIPAIKEALMDNLPYLGEFAFRIMKDYPDTVYLEVLDAFEKHGLWSSIFDPFDVNVNIPRVYYETLASYKQERAAEILSRMLYRQPLSNYNYFEPAELKKYLMYAIWDNRCPAYASMTRYIKDSIAAYEAAYKKASKGYDIVELVEPLPDPINEPEFTSHW
jgi:hypothetical protein